MNDTAMNRGNAMSGQALWITEAEVAALVDMGDAIAALERGLSAEARGGAVNMAKTHTTFGHGDTLHAIGATMLAEGVVGTKTWAHTEGGANPLLILFDAANGQLVAVIEAFALGQLRTAAISGLATRWLAAPDAAEMALVGAGKQALAQVAAVAAVRKLRARARGQPQSRKRGRFRETCKRRVETGNRTRGEHRRRCKRRRHHNLGHARDRAFSAIRDGRARSAYQRGRRRRAGARRIRALDARAMRAWSRPTLFQACATSRANLSSSTATMITPGVTCCRSAV